MSNATAVAAVTVPSGWYWDAAQAYKFASPIGLIFTALYVIGVVAVVLVYGRYYYFVIPKLAFAKNSEIDALGKQLSAWPRMVATVQNDRNMFILNIIFALITCYGTFTIGSDRSMGSAAVFVGTIGSFLLAMAIFMPNHDLTVPPPEVSSARQFTKVHPPVEQDHYYVVTPGIEEAWRDQPESWTFESQPWGKDVIVHNAVSMPRYQLDLRAFEMPVADLNAVEAEVNDDGDAAQRDAAEQVLVDAKKAAKDEYFQNLSPAYKSELSYVKVLKADIMARI